MALDPNIGRIKFLRSKTAGRLPTTADIDEGELALNLVDRTIYTRNGSNIIDMGFGKGGSVKGNIDVTGNISAAGSITIGALVTASSFRSPIAFKFYDDSSGAQKVLVGGICVSNQYIDESLTPANGIYSKGPITSSGQVTAPGFSGPLNGNASSASVLQISRAINGVGFNGSKDITIPGYFDVVAGDHRQLRPNMTRSAALGVYFTSINGLNSTVGTDYADLLAFNTYLDGSGGLLNGLAFPKTGKSNPIHYRSAFGANEWGAGRTLAYLDDDSTGNSATATRLAQSTRIATGADVAWYRIGKVTIPQTGRTFTLRMYGGGGYTGEPSQSSPATLMLKTGNGANKLASVSLDVVDGTSYPGAVAVLQLDALNFEVFVQFKSYSTFNYIPEIETGTTFDPQWALYPVLPGGTITGQVRVLAQTTSNVASATKLQTPRTINGVAFDGTSDILIQDNHAIRMNNGANFNDYQGPGTYYCDLNVDADTMANRPMDGAFSLEVKRAAGVIQKYTHYETARCFVRKFYNTWGPWREVALLNLENTFTRSQIINGGADSVLSLVGTRESAIVFQKPTRRVVLTLSADNTFGFHTGNGWLIRSPNDQTVDFFANIGVANGFTFMLEGEESDNITRRQNPNASITVNSPEPGMASIRNSMEFSWYGDKFQLGAIRSGSQTSHGFGITKANNHLLWRVDPQGAMYTGRILGREYIDVQGNSIATQMISRSGRFSAPNSAYHYIDVGQDGRDMTTIGQYNGAFQFLNSGTGTVTFSHAGGAQPVISNRRMIVNGDTWAKELGNLGTGNNAAIETTEVSIPAGTNYGYNAMISGKSQVVGAGYRTNVSFGVYKTGYNTFAGSGAYIAVGGSDAAPDEAYRFLTGGEMSHTSGHIAMASDLWLNTGNVRTNSAELQILTTTGQAKRIATGGVLASDSYADVSKVPSLGIYSKGDVNIGGIVRYNKNRGDTDLWFTNEAENRGRRLLTGGILCSHSFSDSGQVPDAGIFAVGDIVTRGQFRGNATSASQLQTPRNINGVAFDGTKDIQTDCVRIGTISWTPSKRSMLWPGDLALDGQVLNRADYPELWSIVSAGRVVTVTDAAWLGNKNLRGNFTPGNGTTTFRLPDLNGAQTDSIPNLFIRGAVNDAGCGAVEDDAIRNITGKFEFGASAFGDTIASGSLISYDAGRWGEYMGHGRYGARVGGVSFDASKTVPVANENRPKSVYGLWIISAKGSNVIVPGASTAATLTGGNTFQGGQKIVGPLEVTGTLNADIKPLLNASGAAPVFGVRAWASIQGQTGNMFAQGNVLSVQRTSQGRYTIKFVTPMPHANYAISCAAMAVTTDTRIIFAFGDKTAAGFSLEVVAITPGWHDYVDSGDVSITVTC